MSYRFMLPAQWRRGPGRPAGTSPAHLTRSTGGYLPFCLEFTESGPQESPGYPSASVRALDRCRTSNFTISSDALPDGEDS